MQVVQQKMQLIQGLSDQPFHVTSVDASIHGPWRQPRKDPGAPLFRNFANKLANLLRLGKKKNKFFCFALNFS